MKQLSLPHFFVLGVLALVLGACAMAAPGPKDTAKKDTDVVAAGPLGPPVGSAKKDDAAPPPPPPPPDDNVPFEGPPKNAITAAQGEGGVVEAKKPDLDGAADPLTIVQGGDTAEKPPARTAVAAGPKGRGSHAGLSDPLPGGEPGAMTIGAATEVRGSLDKEEIRRVIRAHVNEVKRCYDQGLARRPDMEGKVVLKFTIGKTGTVVAASVQETSVNDKPVEVCITSAALKWTFPKPTGEGVVTISYPFVLKSGG